MHRLRERGEAFGEHGVFMHDDLYGGTLRVPLIFRFPGHLPAGRRVAAPAAVIDVMPTVLALIGVPAPPAVQGRNLAPLVLGAAPDPGAGDVVSEYSQLASHRGFLTHAPPPLALAPARRDTGPAPVLALPAHLPTGSPSRPLHQGTGPSTALEAQGLDGAPGGWAPSQRSAPCVRPG